MNRVEVDGLSGNFSTHRASLITIWVRCCTASTLACCPCPFIPSLPIFTCSAPEPFRLAPSCTHRQGKANMLFSEYLSRPAREGESKINREDLPVPHGIDRRKSTSPHPTSHASTFPEGSGRLTGLGLGGDLRSPRLVVSSARPPPACPEVRPRPQSPPMNLRLNTN